MVRLEIGGRTYLLSGPDDIRHVLVSNAANYEKTPRIRSTRRRRFFGQGLVTTEGPGRLRQRRLLQPLFHHDLIATFSAIIVRGAEEMLDGWRDGGQIDLHAEMLALTQRIITRVMLGDDFATDGRRFMETISVRRRYQEYLLGSVFPYPEYLPNEMNREHARANRDLNAILDRAIERRRTARTEPADMLSLLVLARYDDGTGMSNSLIREEARTLALGGYETLAEALTWTWYLLAGSPSVESELRTDADRVAATGSLDGVDYRTLSYCRMVLSEAMRLYPPTWLFVRVARRADVLPGGVRIPAGAKIYLSQWVMHRHPAYFPEPDRFDPQRFTEAAIGVRPRFVYFPFGAGQRLCIGEEFAWMEGVLLLASIARRFGFLLAPGQSVVPEPNVTLRPRSGLIARIVGR